MHILHKNNILQHWELCFYPGIKTRNEASYFKGKLGQLHHLLVAKDTVAL